MQVRRTVSIGAVPTGLSEGQLSVGMADQPPIAWVGVPTSVNPLGVIPITGLVRTVAGAPQPAGAVGQLWWDEDGAQLYVYTGSEWVVAVNPPPPDVSAFVTQTQLAAALQLKVTYQTWGGANPTGVYVPPAGLQYAIVDCLGGGGGGGGTYAVGTGTAMMGGGGGAGGNYAMSILSAAQIGVSQNVTAGAQGGPGTAGGTSSFGALVVAGGGNQGNYQDLATTWGEPGTPSSTGTGNVMTLSGGSGGWAYRAAPTNWVVGGEGGRPAIGGGTFQAAAQVGPGQSKNGTSGTPGCGGSGAATSNHGANFSLTGGTGGAGWVRVIEYSF